MPKKRRYWNPRAQQRINPRTGKFMKKPGTKPLTPALPANADLMTCLASLSSPMTIAKRVERLARGGDGAALALQIQALNQLKPELGDAYDTSKLSENLLRILLVALKRAGGESVPDIEILQHARAIVAELNYLDPGPVLPDDDGNQDDEDQEDLMPVELPMPEPSPLPVPRAQPMPKKYLVADRYDPDLLDRCQPSIGNRRSGLMGIHNNRDGDYDDPSERAYDPADLGIREVDMTPAPDKNKKQRTN